MFESRSTMVNLESRVDLAAEWLLANITHEESDSGWGWVADFGFR